MLTITINMDNKNVSNVSNLSADNDGAKNATNAEFYLLLIAIKLGFLSGIKILKTIINAYQCHKKALKKKYTSEA